MAQNVPDEKKITLKALVDKGRNRVIFVEADNDFIDVLFSFLTIPMGHIVRLARDHSTPMEIGCMYKLYKSIDKIDVQVFRSEECREMLLLPHSTANCHCKNLKLKLIDHEAEPTRFRCSNMYNCSQPLYTYNDEEACSNCSCTFKSEIYLSEGDTQVRGVFVKERARVIITDDFQVIPPLSAASISLFTKLGAMNSNTTEELTFSIGVEQVIFQGFFFFFNILFLCLGL